jgi:uncharacterized protein (TIGR02646 family)
VRRIYKTDEPAALEDWKADKNWQGNPPSWRDFSAEAYAAVKATTARDQRQLCCYCAGWIGDGAAHVEHFRPQSVFPSLRFAWPNLLASCESPSKGWIANPAKTQRHCGHKKDNWFDPTLTIDPQTDVAALFRYKLDGRVYAAKDLPIQRYNAVMTTIEKLNLDAPALRERRKAVLADAAEDAETMSHNAWRTRYLNMDNEGCLIEFWPALKYNYDKFWRDQF